MRYRYYICDVFTESRFGGNQLAVLPEARGLSDERMQQIAREFNFSETTFVMPAESDHTRKVRIFTPAREVPFASCPVTTRRIGEIMLSSRYECCPGNLRDRRRGRKPAAQAVSASIQSRNASLPPSMAKLTTHGQS